MKKLLLFSLSLFNQLFSTDDAEFSSLSSKINRSLESITAFLESSNPQNIDTFPSIQENILDCHKAFLSLISFTEKHSDLSSSQLEMLSILKSSILEKATELKSLKKQFSHNLFAPISNSISSDNHNLFDDLIINNPQALLSIISLSKQINEDSFKAIIPQLQQTVAFLNEYQNRSISIPDAISLANKFPLAFISFNFNLTIEDSDTIDLLSSNSTIAKRIKSLQLNFDEESYDSLDLSSLHSLSHLSIQNPPIGKVITSNIRHFSCNKICRLSLIVKNSEHLVIDSPPGITLVAQKLRSLEIPIITSSSKFKCPLLESIKTSSLTQVDNLTLNKLSQLIVIDDISQSTINYPNLHTLIVLGQISQSTIVCTNLTNLSSGGFIRQSEIICPNLLSLSVSKEISQSQLTCPNLQTLTIPKSSDIDVSLFKSLKHLSFTPTP